VKLDGELTELFVNKTILVTGGSRGIGRAIALKFAKQGATVVVNYRKDREAADSLIREIEKFGARGFAVKADISSEEDVEAMFQLIKEAGLSVDVLVNNAGVRKDGYLMMMEHKDWHKVIDTNLTGTYLCSKIAVREMMKKKAGSIISLSSNSGLTGVGGQTNYSASKGAILSFTKALAREVGRFGVRVNAVAPGLIETDMTNELNEQIKAQMISQISLNRIGKPEDVADAVCFLASDQAAFITGHTLVVNGGDVL